MECPIVEELTNSPTHADSSTEAPIIIIIEVRADFAKASIFDFYNNA